MPELLSRYAESIFWMARYIERAENLARILDVSASSAGGQSHADEWRTVLRVNSDEERFSALGHPAVADRILHFYVLDDDNPTSIRTSIRAAFENARSLRPFISAEMWTQLNIFQKWLREQNTAALSPSTLPRLLERVKSDCQTHTGIAEGTFHRDQGWLFYRMGRYIERADQTTRLLDARFIHHSGTSEANSPLESGHWGATLHCAAGYHAFRRVHPTGMVPAEIAGFMLLHPEFPRSVALCVGETDRLLSTLRSRYGLRGGIAAIERLDGIKAALFQRMTDTLRTETLHDLLDWLQTQLIPTTESVAADFFGR